MALTHYECYFRGIRSSYALCPSDFPCLNMWLNEPSGHVTVPPEYAVYFNSDSTTIHFSVDALVRMKETKHEAELAAITSLVVYCLADFRSWFHLFDMWDRIDLCSNLRKLKICCAKQAIAEEVVFELYDGLQFPEEVFHFNESGPIEFEVSSFDALFHLKGQIDKGRVIEESGRVIGKM